MKISREMLADPTILKTYRGGQLVSIGPARGSAPAPSPPAKPPASSALTDDQIDALVARRQRAQTQHERLERAGLADTPIGKIASATSFPQRKATS